MRRLVVGLKRTGLRVAFHKSVVAAVLLSLFMSLTFSIVRVEAQASYIIVHAHNPEGVEIASIEGMNSQSVETYDGATLIGYGAHDSDSHKKPLAVLPGSHTIKAKFNGLTLEQNVNLQEGETRALIFIFPRTIFNLMEEVRDCDIQSSISGQFSGPSQEICVNVTCPWNPAWVVETSFWDPCTGRSGVYSLKAKLYFDVSENQVNWTSYVYADIDESTGTTYSPPPHNPNTTPYWQSRASATGSEHITMNTLSSDFSNWYIQYTSFCSGMSLKIDGVEYLGTQGANMLKTTSASQNSLLDVSWGNFLSVTGYNANHYFYGDRLHMWNEFIETGGGTLSLQMASVPYDLTGTGVKDEENQPPVASFTYSPEKPMVGGNITFDASPSYDPDGTIEKYEWDLGDGSTGMGKVATHTYSSSGNHTVTLTVTDDKGATDSKSETLTIKGKEFMITFDDGPLPGKTDKIVETLRDFRVNGEPVKAGFFMVGDNDPSYHSWFEFWPDKGSVKDYPQAAQKVAEAGHIVGDHTQHHAWFDSWQDFGYTSMKDFVIAEIDQCNNEIEEAIGNTASRVFRPPYLQDHQEVYEGADELGFQIVWGKTVGDTGWRTIVPFFSDYLVKKSALQILKSWDWEKGAPAVLIFHDISPVTYDHIGEIVSYLQDEGFTLVNFDPSLVGGNKSRPALSGIVHSPVDLEITDPDGLILRKQESQIQDALYEEVDVDGDGDLEDFFIIPESKIGSYLVHVIPEPGALPTDTYSLEVGVNDETAVLADNVQIRSIPSRPYIVRLAESGDFVLATIESCDSSGTSKDVFDINEQVYVKGSGYSPSTTCSIYLVSDTNWTDGMLILGRIGGTATTMTSDASGNISSTMIWNTPLKPGKYDIIVDVNNDGYYSATIDALDESNTQIKAGLLVIPEYWLGTVLGLVACLAAFGLYQLPKRTRPTRS